MPITIRKSGLTLDYKRWTFPSGEVGVRLDTANLRYRDAVPDLSASGPYAFWQTIWARLQSSADVMELVLLVDALRRWDSTPIHLVCPCLPYARQDRVGLPGESHSLRAFAAIINGLGFERVTVFDAHSDVTGAVLDRVVLIDQATIIGRFDAFNARLNPAHPADRPLFCSPDAGAIKKTAALAAFYGHDRFVRADKTRDLATGKLTGFKVYAEPGEIEGRDVIMVDDLCCGGGTFTGLAAELRKAGARRVELYTTHAIYSKGIQPLLEGGLIDHLWATDAYRDPRTLTMDTAVLNRLTVLPLEEAFRTL